MSSWADLADLDDSRDGLNLLLKQSSVSDELARVSAVTDRPGSRKRTQAEISKTPAKSKGKGPPTGPTGGEEVQSPAPQNAWGVIIQSSPALSSPLIQPKPAAVEKKQKVASKTSAPAAPVVATVTSPRSMSWAAVVNPAAAAAASSEDAEGGEEGTAVDSAASPSAESRFPFQPVSELTETRIEQRERQLQRGRRTPGYQAYAALFSTPAAKKKRRAELVAEGATACEAAQQVPDTPDKTREISKRQFDGHVRQWRRALHAYDPEGTLSTKRVKEGDEETKGEEIKGENAREEEE